MQLGKHRNYTVVGVFYLLRIDKAIYNKFAFLVTHHLDNGGGGGGVVTNYREITIETSDETTRNNGLGE